MLKIMKLDWNALKYYHIRLLIIPLTLLVLGLFSSIYLVPLGVLLSFSFSINSFLVEEKSDLNRLYLTLPIKRSHVVLSRYLLSLILSASGALLGLSFMPLANLFSFSKWYPDFKWSLALLSFSSLLYALMNLFMYPVLFKLGYQKGKIWGFYIPTILICLALNAFLLAKGNLIFNLLVYASEHFNTVICGTLISSAAVLTVSCLLSIRIYSRREF